MDVMDEEENRVKRERQRKEETNRRVEEMRAALKPCTKDAVRRYKMPYDKALLIELEEKGYVMTVKIIQQLLDFEDEMIQNSPILLRRQLRLKTSKSLLRSISDKLSTAEEYHKHDDYENECKTIIKVAVSVAFSDDNWWWLGEQLLLYAISTSEKYPSFEGKYVALSKYAYAKFLLENIKEYEGAREYLMRVRSLATNKKWMTSVIFPDEKNYLYTRANYQLHLSLFYLAKSYMKSDFSKTIKLATESHKRAAEACYLEGETKALVLKGLCELGLKLTNDAYKSFAKACRIEERLGNVNGVCETKLFLARAYLMHGDTLQSLKCLLKAKDLAEMCDLQNYLADAYRYLGEFYLNSGEPNRATPLLGQALKILYETNNIRESEQVRNLEAISTGLELFPKYIKLLSDISDPEQSLESINKLIDWKDSRKQFWPKVELGSDMSCDGTTEAIVNDLKEILSAEKSSRSFANVSMLDKDKEIVELHVNTKAYQGESVPELVVPEQQVATISINEEEPNKDLEELEKAEDNLPILNKST